MNGKTPAMVLQELTVQHSFSPPEYNLIFSKSGSHENVFHYEVEIQGVCAVGLGSSKKVAKHDAASKVLEKLAQKGICHSGVKPESVQELHSPPKKTVNCITMLRELCMENKMPSPDFTKISDIGPPHCREFTYQCTLGSFTCNATSSTKKQAKQVAAQHMWDKITAVWPEFVESFISSKATLDEQDESVLGKYLEANPSSVKPNLAVPVNEYHLTLSKLMTERSLTINDFAEDFRENSEESLKSLLSKLDLTFNYEVLQQEDPCIVCLNVSNDTPLAVLEKGDTMEEAKSKALLMIFEHIKFLMEEN